MSTSSKYPYKTITLQNPQNNSSFLLEMVKVEGGKAKIGEGEGKHWINIPTFYIGKYPVTQALYEFVLGKAANLSRFKSQDRPVENVSWNDSKAFLKKLNSEFVNGKGFRLPSESEWEYAGRGGKHWRNNFEFSGSKDLKEVGWYRENSHGETFPVGWKKPNQLGIYDMSGNVWEWCEDDWHDNYKNAPDDGSAWVDERRVDNRLLRGGGWDYDDGGCRVSYRSFIKPTYRSINFGFRLVLPQY